MDDGDGGSINDGDDDSDEGIFTLYVNPCQHQLKGN